MEKYLFAGSLVSNGYWIVPYSTAVWIDVSHVIKSNILCDVMLCSQVDVFVGSLMLASCWLGLQFVCENGSCAFP
jgi:hypothetical protein